ncbi:MAG: response regulator, partial [Calditrichota bacterium]
IAYFLGAVFFLIGFSRFRVRQLKQKTVELESIVAERTVELREQKDQVEAQAAQLREMDKYKSRFFTNISHEFRTPLTLILGPLEDMLAKAGGASERMNLGLMQRNGRRLLQLINQLLDLSRLESGRLTLEVREGNLAEFMRGLVMSFASLAEKRELQLQLDIDSDEQFHRAWYDADKIEKIVVNLLSNAFRFTESGGQVQVWLKRGGNNAEIAVRDTGKGIPEEQLEKIFERFHSELSGRGAFDGSGVGLSLTKEMISMHHGSIRVESSEGEGSSFIFKFPIHRTAYTDEEIVPDLNPIASENSERITERVLLEDDIETMRQVSVDTSAELGEEGPLLLIIDDNPDVRRYVGAQLTEYTLLKAPDGRQGLEIATEHLPDLVVSDVMMPEMDGYEFCEKLKTNEKTCHIPVILLTAKADEGDRIEGLETGADDYLIKPFNAKELRTRVSNLIDSRKKLREIFRREGILQPKDVPATSMEEAFLRKLVDLVERELTTEEFGPEVLSTELGMSSRQLQRKIKALTGQTPSDFIRSQRLQRARILLEKRSGTVSEIAYEVGFNNLSYFARSFRKEFGVAPSELLAKK